ncbi:NAD(P)/FAD-dependent oxidoreductase [Sunxiuqinia dokdonensis]|uniref:NADH:ubiquinone reductase (non-electrogenic) n=1 Tax=Sunxiuqinia dokdonensis TaxID=1409788 RepID=A0A0L8V9Y7_9BACT|nr:NAD(P)/FAD-dependent oxidoreductase [Sunxiuqinia dokdonensis]KOH45244.1 NADH dehydrogenase [Sunxiuqinia dokdonensis]
MTNQEHLFSINIPDTKKSRIVIIGGGFGGVQLLKNLNSDYFQIVLLDRYNYHTFQPLLYQVATAGLEPDSIAGPLRKVINRKPDTHFRMLKVNRINPNTKTVKTSAGVLNYDYLVISTGAQINYFGNRNIAEHAFPLKQITHALDLRSHIFQQFEKAEIMTSEKEKKKLMTFVIVGAGPTGVEVCGSLAELKNKVLPKDYSGLDFSKMEIHLIEGLDRILPSMSEKSGKKAKKYLEKMGVHIVLNCMTDDYDGEVVKLDNGTTIHAGTLIWAAGVKGNLIDGFGKKSILKGKLVVDEINRVFKDQEQKQVYENLFAIGDVAHMLHPDYPKGLPGLAQAAIQQGRQLGKNLNRLHQAQTMKPFHYKNKGVLATIGRNKAVADFPGDLNFSGALGWFIWMVVHLLFLIGFRNKAVVFANWSWNYFTYDRGIRLILRPSTKENDAVSREMIEAMKETQE